MLIVVAAVAVLAPRIATRKRAPPTAPSVKRHVVIGLATSFAAFLHTLLVLPALGSEAAVGGGELALLAGAGAFCVMVAHAGLGLRLRDPKLRDRVPRRRSHVLTAIGLTIAVAVHAVLLSRAR